MPTQEEIDFQTALMFSIDAYGNTGKSSDDLTDDLIDLGVLEAGFRWVRQAVDGQVFYEGNAGFGATLYLKQNITTEEYVDAVLAFRATDALPDNIENIPGSVNDLIADFDIALGNQAQQFVEAEAFYKKVITEVLPSLGGVDPTSINLSFAGYSLGGGLAQYMGAITGLDTVTINGVGVKEQLKTIITDIDDQPFNITNYITNDDFVATMYDQVGTNKYGTVDVVIPDWVSTSSPIAFLAHSLLVHLSPMIPDVITSPTPDTLLSDYYFSHLPSFSSRALYDLRVSLTGQTGYNLQTIVNNLASWTPASWLAAHILTGLNPYDGIQGANNLPGVPNWFVGTAREDVGDLLVATSGNDTLIGDGGPDTLYGGAGDDTYFYKDNQVLIQDSAGTDNIQFGTREIANVDLATDGDDLVVTLDLYGDEEVTIQDHFISDKSVEKLQFVDGEMALGSNVGDSLAGSGTSDVIYAFDGNDTLTGGQGNDTLYGGDGNDIYHFAIGDGHDVVSDESGTDSIILGEGFTIAQTYRTIAANGSDLIITFGNSADSIKILNHFVGDKKIEKIKYSNGDDFDLFAQSAVNGSSAGDFLYGDGYNNYIAPPANDDYTFNATADYFDGKEGVDRIHGDVSIIDSSQMGSVHLIGSDNILFGGAGGDFLWGNGSVNSALGKLTGGDNYLDGGDGNDTMQGNGSAGSTYSTQLSFLIGGNNTLIGGAGHDNIIGAGGVGSNNGSAILYAGNNHIEGGDGDDFVYGAGDVAVGSSGNATLEGGTNTVYGGSGDDTLYGDGYIHTGEGGLATIFGGNNLISGGDGSDDIFGSGWADQIGETIIKGGGNTLTGDAGNDMIFGDGYVMDSDIASTGSIGSIIGGNDLLSGGNDHDYMVGDGYLSSRTGDTLSLVGGGDYLQGDAGNDFLIGDGAIDLAFGGSASLVGGNDLLEGGGDDDLLVGDGYIYAQQSGYLYTNIFDATAYGADTSIHDIISWGAELYSVFGPGTLNSISYQGGNDTLYGGSGNDYLIGDGLGFGGYGGNDSLSSGSGDDTLNGNGGNDTLTGGVDDDLYLFNAGDGQDTILEQGSDLDSDTIQFGTGITDQDVTFSKSGLDLILSYGTSDQITVKNHFNSLMPYARIENFEFDSGPSMTYQDVLDLFADASPTINGSSGDDFVYASSTYQTVSTGTGNDFILLSSLGDVADGGDGNDTIDAGSGNDTLIGGDGDDTFIVNAANVTITENSNEGNDTVVSNLSQTLSSHIENLTLTGSSNINGTGNTANNILTGNDGNNSLTGADGDDTLDGGLGNDTLVGGSGNDVYRLSDDFGTDAISDNSGSNTLDLSSVTSAISFDNETLATATTGTHSVSWTLGTDILSEVYLGSGNDSAYGSSGADVLYGGAGDDSIDGNGGNDSMDGEAGNDTLEGGSGTDSVAGGDGDDLFIEASGSGNDTYGGGEGYDTLDYSALSGSVTASLANSTISDGTDTDSFSSVEHIKGSASSQGDVIDGAGLGAGLSMSLETGTISVSGNDLAEISNFEHLSGTAYADDLSGDGNANEIIGGDGDDTISGGAGNDTLSGGSGNDTYRFSDGFGNDTLTDASGSNTLDFSALTDALSYNASSGSVAADTSALSWSTGYFSQVLGGEGDDTLTGGTQADTLFGGAGNDLFVEAASSGSDTYSGGAGTDTVDYSALSSATTLSISGTGITVISASDTDTLLDIEVVKASVNASSDEIDASQSAVGIYADLENGVLHVPGGTTSAVENFENVTGSAYSDLIIGNSADNAFTGGAGDDYLAGGDGNDTLNGEDGNDLLDGGVGEDDMYGGEGDDLYIVDDADDWTIESASEGTDTVQTGLDWQLSANIENLTLTGTGDIEGIGNGLDNVLIGNSGGNFLLGGDGNDTLDGGSGGVDELEGGYGDDAFIVDRADVTVLDWWNQGTDTVYASISYTLGDDVENLILTGTSAINGTGNNLDNVMTGNSADNILDGSGGDDTLTGGLGNDTYRVQSYYDVVVENTGEGIDTTEVTIDYTLSANVENLNLLEDGWHINGTGNELDNVITGNIYNNNLYGEDGNDTLDGVSGTDYMEGGLGDDVYFVNSTSDTVSEYSNEGTDTVHSTISFTLDSDLENLILTGSSNINGTGASNNNQITGNSGNNNLAGGDGNDTITGGTGNDTMNGGAGDDTYLFGNTWDTDSLSDASGTDSMDFSAMSNDVYYNDAWQYKATSGANTVTWSSASDFEIVIGGSGNDTIYGGGGNETLYGGDGMDSIFGSSGNDLIYGGDGNDTIQGETGDDSLYGEAGDDVFTEHNTSNSDSLLDGGSGFDTADYSVSPQATTVDLAANNSDMDQVRNNSYTDSLVSVEKVKANTTNAFHMINASDSEAAVVIDLETGSVDSIYSDITTVENFNLASGSAYGDVLIGNGNSNSLSGNGGNDTITGGAGNDTLTGGSGDDTYIFEAGWGADTIGSEGGGTDTLDLSAITSAITYTASPGSLTAGTDSITWNTQNTSFEVLLGGSGNDSFTASGFSHTIYGGQGHDTISSNTGAFNDYFDGGAGNDSLYGGNGNDTLDGGAGDDTLEGSSGNDTYLFAQGDGQDTITDSGNTDTVIFDNSISQSVVAIFETTGGDLQIGYTDSSGDLVTIDNFGTSGNEIERFELSTGVYMTDSDINQILSDMADYASTHSISLTSLDDVKNDSNLMAIVNSGWQS